MDKPQVFIDITCGELHERVRDYCARGWHFANLCGCTVDGGVELIYSFSDGLPVENLRLVTDLSRPIASVSDCFPNAFFFENETHDLFGVPFSGISIDFDGTFYRVSVPTPMNPGAVNRAALEAAETSATAVAEAAVAETAEATAAAPTATAATVPAAEAPAATPAASSAPLEADA
ncbi:MAG: NADH-quinone oxidoreductase subunit C [Coriobacteriales bacterium]|nr:NADH-quinone oxidoreductase subunit C [Coriobacteriales bacterium]